MTIITDFADSEHIKDFTEILDGDWSTASRLAAINRAFCIVELAPDGTLVHANRVYCKLCGYKRAELIGEHHKKLVFPTTRDSAEYTALWTSLAAGRVVDGVQLRRHADGSAIWVQAIYTPVLNPQGRVQRILKVALDVTAPHTKAIEAESTLKAIDRSSGVVSMALDGTILEANLNFAHSLGYEPEQVIGQHHVMMCDDKYAASREYAEFWSRLRDGEFVSGKFERKTRSGKKIIVRASYSPIFDAEGNVYKILKVSHVASENPEQRAAA